MLCYKVQLAQLFSATVSQRRRSALIRSGPGPAQSGLRRLLSWCCKDSARGLDDSPPKIQGGAMPWVVHATSGGKQVAQGGHPAWLMGQNGQEFWSSCAGMASPTTPPRRGRCHRLRPGTCVQLLRKMRPLCGLRRRIRFAGAMAKVA